ncbi:hypothetical protein JCM16138_07670 [Thermococcus atlanticus]
MLAGYRGENFWVRVGKEDFELGEGSATSLLPFGDKFLVGGELDGKAVVVEVSDGESNLKKLWNNGWVEVLSQTLALGVKGREMVIFPF